MLHKKLINGYLTALLLSAGSLQAQEMPNVMSVTPVAQDSGPGSEVIEGQQFKQFRKAKRRTKKRRCKKRSSSRGRRTCKRIFKGLGIAVGVVIGAFAMWALGMASLAFACR